MTDRSTGKGLVLALDRWVSSNKGHDRKIRQEGQVRTTPLHNGVAVVWHLTGSRVAQTKDKKVCRSCFECAPGEIAARQEAAAQPTGCFPNGVRGTAVLVKAAGDSAVLAKMALDIDRENRRLMVRGCPCSSLHIGPLECG